MAYFKFKRIHGQKYLYIAETRLVNGKPTPVTLAYLGKADGALARLQGAAMGNERLRSFSHGAVAVLLSLADRLGVAELFDQHATPPRKGATRRSLLSVGQTLVLGAVGLAVRPTSKRGWANWARGTTLAQLIGGRGWFPVDRLTSQFFWDQMDRVPSDALPTIGAELARRVGAEERLTVDRLFYDTTNFFTFIDSRNSHCDLPQRGYSKQKRNDLRQINVGLLVSLDGWIPLRYDVYPGNVNDVTIFPSALEGIPGRLKALDVALDDVTMICDKGNLSEANWELLNQSGLHFVASVAPGRVPDIAYCDGSHLSEVEVQEVGHVRALRTMVELGGRRHTAVVLDSPTLRDGQLRGLQQQLWRPLAELQRLRENLRRGRRRSRGAVERQLNRILRPAQIGRVVQVELRETRDGRVALDWMIDAGGYVHLRDRVFGRRVLVTDRSSWNTGDIIGAYWGQSEVEHVFMALKDPRHCALHTPYHWTDQKLEVHTFLVVFAYMLLALLRRRARRMGYSEDIGGLIELLDTIRVVLCTERRGRPGRPRVRWQREDADERALRLYREIAHPRYDLGSMPIEA